MTKPGFLLIGEKGQPGGVEIEGTADALMQDHLVDINPHTQYVSETQRQADLTILANSISSVAQSAEAKGVADTKIAQHKIENNAHTASQVGADPIGTAASLLSSHLATPNPHGITKSIIQLGNVSNDAQLKIASNLADLSNSATARTNLGLGSAALFNSGDFAPAIHTHAITNITGLQAALDSKLNSTDYTLNLGSKRHTRSRTPPTNPQIGDSWDELDANDQFVHSWFWNGVYWLSERIYIKEPSINNISSNLQIYYELPSDTNIFVVGFKPNVLLGSTNTTNSNWVFTLNRTGSSTVALATVSSSAAAPNGWFSNMLTVNTHVNVATTGSRAFRIDVTKNSVASNISGSVAIFYRLARI